MKSLNSMKNYGLALMAMMLMLTAANAQKRYSHVPRVKIDGKKTEKLTVPVEKSVSTTTAAYMSAEENNAVATEPTVNVENTSVASTSDDVVVDNNKTKSVIKNNKAIKTNKKSKQALGIKKAKFNFFNPFANIKDTFQKQIESKSKLLKVTDNKNALEVNWTLLMILGFIIGGALITLYIILAIAGGFYGGYGWWWILTLGIVCIGGAITILILRAVGVIS